MNQENLNMPNCIRTHSGIYVNVFDPKPEMFIIEDIAHALSHQCRFGGHLPKFYSVAQHSVLVANLVPQEKQLQAIMHDASEAYLLDMPSPIKRQLKNYNELEQGIMEVISKKFGFEWPMSREVKEADEIMLYTEWHELMLGQVNGRRPFHIHDSQSAKQLFLAMFETIKAKFDIRATNGE